MQEKFKLENGAIEPGNRSLSVMASQKPWNSEGRKERTDWGFA